MTNQAETRTRAWLSSHRGAQLAGVVLLGALALVLFTNLRTDSIGRSSEKRAMTVARGMVESGDWLVPRFQDKPRLQKPPLFYWLGATTAHMIGDTGPIAVRLPSAFACLGLVALVMAWARSLGGAGTGLVAGAALVAAIQVSSSGRRGDAEMLLALLVVASLFVFDRLYTTRRRALLPLFGVLAGLAILTKATAVLIAIGLPILVFLALERELRRLVDPGVAGACALALAIGLSWYVAVIALVPGAFDSLWSDLILPLGAGEPHGDAAHFRPVWWYLGVLPMRAAPLSLLLPLVAWRLYTTRVYRDEPRWRFAALTFLAPFVAFSLLPQKQDHYTLSMLPGLALVTAEALAALSERLREPLARGIGAVLALAGIAGSVLVALFFLWIEGLPPIGVAVGGTVLVGVFALALAAALRGRPATFAAAWVPAFLLLVAAHRGVVSVRVARLENVQSILSLPVAERDRIVRTARAHPWFVDVFRLAGDGKGDGDQSSRKSNGIVRRASQ